MRVKKNGCVLIVVLASTLLIIGGCGYNRQPIEDVEVDYSEKPVDTWRSTDLTDHQVGTCQNLLLEITTLRGGMTSPKGRILDIRILDNGAAEYDTYDSSVPNSAIFRKRKTLAKEQVGRIRKILDSKQIVNARGKYPGDPIISDVYLEKRVTYCDDSYNRFDIIVTEEDVTIEIDRKIKIPDEIIRLFKIVDGIR